MRPGRRRRRRLAVLAGLAVALLVPAVCAAHPLGNFTINHYAGLRITADRILLDVVIDQAEIPTFEERRRLDLDEDGDVSDAEIATGRQAECDTLATSLTLKAGGRMLPLRLTAAGLSFPLGAGLPTMRVVCEYVAALAAPLAAGTTIEFQDRSFEQRLGWREIVVEGDGVTLESTGDQLLATSLSARLTQYPDGSLSQPLAMDRVTFRATPGGPPLPPVSAHDAIPIDGSGSVPIPEPGPAAPAPAAVPAGVGAIPAIFGATDLSPVVALLSLLTAVALGAGHALTPGHGKTLMAAYLVGRRGTAVHAAGLGLSVTVSHTLGILILAAVVVGVQGVLPADTVVRTMPAIAAIAVLAIGGWMVSSEIRRLWAVRRFALAHRGDAHPNHDHGRDHAHDHGHDHGHDHAHVTEPGSTISWRSLFALGLAGGIVPSASALLILLGAIVAGRPAFGVVLVVAFGLGMALVLAGVGVAIVRARGWLDGASFGSRFHVVSAYAPLIASIVVVTLGVWLTAQALLG